ncbi:synaptic vesicle 2-related protein-like isoform X2 [Uloborus diversus]|uniref:synaptic vesicle 2-related protein-like isoform X2 n=1 Tax=Uloborus diversus TaxID=327109 RepID=UPI002409BB7C|nr:synaptic vesicle 2-related protein-like isoform X2 [Uloborus diversus]
MPAENNRRIHSSSIDRNEISAENGQSADLVQNDIFTPEEAINFVGIGHFQVKLTLLSGFVWMARGFEAVVIKYVGNLVACSWNIARWHNALITTVTCLSSMLGCFLYGIWSDKYGRRTALSSSLIFLVVFGAVSSGLPSYTWYIVFRAVGAFAIGGLPQALTLCCEYVPGRQRGRAIFILSFFWALGVVILLSFLYFTLETSENWRLFLAFASLPAAIAMVMMRWFPESFRYLLVSEQYVAAGHTLAEMALTNRKDLPRGSLNPLVDRKRRGRPGLLFTEGQLKSTLLFMYMGVATGVAYYGLDMMTPHLTRYGTQNSFLIFFILVDVIDRKILLSASCLLCSLFTFLLLLPTSDPIMPIAFFFCARTLLISQFDMLLLMTAEAFPTTQRGLSVGLETATYYLGQLISSYAVQGLLINNFILPVSFIGILMFFSAVSSACLTWETRGLELQDVLKFK